MFLAAQYVALHKDSDKEAIRLICVKRSLIWNFHKEVVKQIRGMFMSYLEPEQLTISKILGQKLVHCVRTLMKENPTFIA